ncbi:MAG: hypothetical protein ABW090_05685 [Sedimenticola sp.]
MLIEIIGLIEEIEIKFLGTNPLPENIPKTKLRRLQYKRRDFLGNLSLKILNIRNEWEKLDASIDRSMAAFNSIGKRRHHVLSYSWLMNERLRDPLLRITGPSLRIIRYPVDSEGVKYRLMETGVKFNDQTIRQCQMSRHRRRLRKARQAIRTSWLTMRHLIDALREIRRVLKKGSK